MKRNLQPAGHRVLIKLKQSKKEVTSFGLEIVEDERVRQGKKYAMTEAKVVALGMNAFKAFDDGVPWCKVGDTVLVSKYSGETIEGIEDDEIYRLINDEDIHGVYVGE